ncbi:ABC transporter permease [Rapidithrix thailandica]|uniref:ABC transporter permease n=1 Tax=Rapidithrix thailandica TaxID=413964 RepID=A0AAW9S512_9BACT
MIKYLIGKLIYGFLVILGVVHVVFFLFHALPGDPVEMMAGPQSNNRIREKIRTEMGLDQPLSMQFLHYLNDLSPLSVHRHSPEAQHKYNYTPLASWGSERVFVLKRPFLRRSFQSNRRVDEIVWENLLGTFWLTLTAMFFATITGVGLGVLSALGKGSWYDHTIISISVLGMSIPSFIVAISLAMLFGYYWSHFTGLELTGSLWVNSPLHGRQLQLKNLILPALALSVRPLALIVQLTRNSMIEVLSQDYIRTAYAKGLNRRRIILFHALRNALNPVTTAVSGWLASLMAGAFFVEYVFSWKGIGLKTIQAVNQLDFPVIMGATLSIAAIFVMVNFLMDLIYAWLDPKVRGRLQ